MTDNSLMDELKNEYVEALNCNREISFNYKGDHYHIEWFKNDVDCSLNHDIETGISVWLFKNKGTNNGVVIGTATTPGELMELPCFNGKNILEIDDDLENCYIH